MTPFYIKIVQLRLEHMGTSKTKVTIYETDLLPLMDHETFGKWAASCKPNKKNKNKNSLKSKITAFAKETTMYQKKADGEVPSGLVALYKVMTLQRKYLFGHTSGLKSDSFQDLIGYGSFSMIYSCISGGSVIKLPRYGSVKQLSNKCSVLIALATGEVAGIVKLEASNNISIYIGNMPIEVPALKLSPTGIPLETYLRTCRNASLRLEHLNKIGNQMHSTLDVIRTKGYSHNNDVSPKNILVKIGSSQCQAFLIDFGISSTTKVALTGYRGTPCYSPLFVIMKYPQAQWKPDKFVDLLALALSIAWVVEPEKIHGHPFSHVHLQEQMARGKKLKLGLKNVLNLHPNS